MAKLPIDFNAASDYSPEQKALEFELAEEEAEEDRQAKRQKTEEAVKANNVYACTGQL